MYSKDFISLCNEKIQNWWCHDLSEDDFLEKISTDFDNLFNVVETISTLKIDPSTEHSFLNKVFKKIQQKNAEQKIDSTSLKKIMVVSKPLFPLLNGETQKELLNLYKNVLTEDNVIDYLENAFKQSNEVSIHHCLKFVEDLTGFSLHWDLQTQEMKISVCPIEEKHIKLVKDILDFLSKNTKGIVVLQKKYKEIPESEISNELIPFVKIYGKFIQKICLDGMINDETISNIISECPYISTLEIISNLVSTHGLEGLRQAKNLHTLRVQSNQFSMQSTPLIDLSKILPKSLIRLRIAIDEKTESLPDELPPDLEELSILVGYDGGQFKSLGKSLPPKLKVLELLNCRKLESLPEKLPEGLIHLELQACFNLKKLPNPLPDSLETLIVISSDLEALPDYLSKNLKKLTLKCVNVKAMPQQMPEGLIEVDLLYSGLIEKFPEKWSSVRQLSLSTYSPSVKLPPNLEILSIKDDSELTELPPLFESLKSLTIKNCEALTSLPQKFPIKLSEIFIKKCDKLSDEYLLLTWLSIVKNNSLKQALKLFTGFGIQDGKALPGLIAECCSASEIKENISGISRAFFEYNTEDIALKMGKSDFDWFLENISEFSIKSMAKDKLAQLTDLNTLLPWSINEETLLKTKCTEEVLKFEDNPNVNLNTLFEIFDAINFSNSKGKDYIDPKTLNDEGTPIDKEKIRSGLSRIIQHIKQLLPIVGIPSDEEKKKAWYADLTNILKAIIVEAQKSDKKTLVAREWIHLGISGLHCGGKWFWVVFDIYKALKGGWEQDIENKSVDALIHSWINEYKAGVIEKMILHYTPTVGASAQPHLYNLIGKVLLEKGITFSNYTIFSIDDPDMPKKIPKENIETLFMKEFEPIKIMKFIHNRLQDSVKSNPGFIDTIVEVIRNRSEQAIADQIKDLEDKLDKQKFDHGVSRAEEIIEEGKLHNKILQALLSNDQKTIEELHSEHPSDYQTIKTKVVVEMENLNITEIISDLNESQKFVLEKTLTSEIQTYEEMLLNRDSHAAKLKELGTSRAVFCLRELKNQLIDDAIKKERWLHYQYDNILMEEAIMMTTYTGTMAFLENLCFLSKVKN